MIEKQLFLHEWGVWLCFLGEPNQSSDDYYKNFQLLFKLASPADLAYSWHHLSLNSLDNYLLKPTGQQNSFMVADKWRRVNSIEYFKAGIEPKWEDPRNEKGGRFVFSVGRGQENREEIYSHLVYYLVGEDFSHSQHINGFRFISPKTAQAFFRVEIWVDFPDDNLDLLRHFQTLLTQLFHTLHYDSKSVRFLNNKAEQREPKV